MSTEIILVAVAGGIGILGSTVGTYLQSRKDLEKEYDIKLREKRLVSYPILWKKFESMSQFFPSNQYPYNRFLFGKFTYGELRKIALDLETWYYGEGGLILDETTRKALLVFQIMVRQMSQAHKDNDFLIGRVDEKLVGICKHGIRIDDFKEVWKVVSSLRSSAKEAVNVRSDQGIPGNKLDKIKKDVESLYKKYEVKAKQDFKIK